MLYFENSWTQRKVFIPTERVSQAPNTDLRTAKACHYYSFFHVYDDINENRSLQTRSVQLMYTLDTHDIYRRQLESIKSPTSLVISGLQLISDLMRSV